MRLTYTTWLLAVLLFSAFATVASAQTAENLGAYVGRYSGFAGSPNLIEVLLESGDAALPAHRPRTCRGHGATQRCVQAGGRPDRGRLPPQRCRGGRSLHVHAGRSPDTPDQSRGARRAIRCRRDSGSAARPFRRRSQGRSRGGEGPDRKGHRRRRAGHAPCQRRANGRRPLNWAALRNDTAMIELLLDAGAAIDATNLSGLLRSTPRRGSECARSHEAFDRERRRFEPAQHQRANAFGVRHCGQSHRGVRGFEGGAVRAGQVRRRCRAARREPIRAAREARCGGAELWARA